MDPRPATLLKYRFGSVAQMQNHLHVVEGRTLFFIREARPTLAAGSRVVVEFAIANSEQVSTQRGSVLARVDAVGGQTGAWIEFPDAKLARRLGQGKGVLAPRAQRRFGCDLLVEVKQERMPYLGRMIDVSLQGVRIVAPSRLEQGSEVEVRIMGAEPPMPAVLGRAQVVRSDPGGDLAVRFVRSDVVARVASGKLFSAVQEAWQKAPEVVHAPTCCQGGQVQEPPLPRMKNRT